MEPGLGVGFAGRVVLPDQEEYGPVLVGDDLAVVGVQLGLVAGAAQADGGLRFAGQVLLGLLDPGVEPGLVGGGVGGAGGAGEGVDDAGVGAVGALQGLRRGLSGIGRFLVGQPDGDLVRLEGDGDLGGLPVPGDGLVGFQLELGQALDAEEGPLGVELGKVDNWMRRGFDGDGAEFFGCFDPGLAAGRVVGFWVDVGVPGDYGSFEGSFGEQAVGLGEVRQVLSDQGQFLGEVVEGEVGTVKVGEFQGQEGGVIEFALLLDGLLEAGPVVPVELAYGAAGDVAFGGANYSSILSLFAEFCNCLTYLAVYVRNATTILEQAYDNLSVVLETCCS